MELKSNGHFADFALDVGCCPHWNNMSSPWLIDSLGLYLTDWFMYCSESHTFTFIHVRGCSVFVMLLV